MTRRIVGVAVAIVLAMIGTVTLAVYVSSAEARALAGEELVEVYVVAAPIPRGTAADEIVDFVEVEQVPAKVRAADSVDNLASLAGLAAAVDLVPGEQLLASRFVQRGEIAGREAGIDVPDDLVEVTVELAAERANGGLIAPGQTVAVLASFKPSGVSETAIPVDGEVVAVPAAIAEGTGGSTPNSTDLLLRKVLVTAVQGALVTGQAQEEGRSTAWSGGPVFVTLAISPFDAERLVFTAEFGDIWLAIERETVPDAGGPGQTRGSVLLDNTGATR